jgi:hypothetical protein
MICNKKNPDNEKCNICIFGFYKDNLNKTPKGCLMNPPYIPVIITSTLNKKGELLCNKT